MMFLAFTKSDLIPNLDLTTKRAFLRNYNFASLLEKRYFKL